MKNIFFTVFLLLTYSFAYSQVQTDEVSVTVTELPNYVVQIEFNPTAALSGVDVLPVTIMFKIPDSENLAGISITPDAGNLLDFSPAVSTTFGGFHYISYQTTSPEPVSTFPAATATSVGQFTIGGVTSSVTIAETDFGPPPAGSSNWFGTAMVQGNNNLLAYPIQNSLVSLPAELTYFQASRYNDNSATLEWETASELDFSHFEIERSMDGRTWNNISKVQGQALNTLGAEYSYLDMNIPLPRATASTVYYRLKMVDNDGVYEYSDIRTVGFESQGVEVEVYPNPTANTITINSEFPVTHVSIFDVDGKLVIDQNFLDAEIDLKQLNSGLYRVVITTEAGQFVKSIVKIN